jgi:hypothetical protein
MTLKGVLNERVINKPTRPLQFMSLRDATDTQGMEIGINCAADFMFN